jgi:hypothetical protein
MAPYGAHADLWGLAATDPHPSAPAQGQLVLASIAFCQPVQLAGTGGPSASRGAFAAQATAAVKARLIAMNSVSN